MLLLLMFCECYTETTTLSNHIEPGNGNVIKAKVKNIFFILFNFIV